MTLIKDRFPSIPMAGKRIPLGDRAKTCIEVTPWRATPPMVKKFLKTTQPETGAIRVFHGRANDLDIASTQVHGVITNSSETTGSLINPAPKTHFQQRLQQLDEANYASHRRAPLGRSHNQSTGLPSWFNVNLTTFGVKTDKGNGAEDLINPRKTSEQVERDYREGHQHYVRTHNAYFVGEHVDRNYTWDRIGKDTRFGVPNPHRNDGHNLSKCLDWPCDKQVNHSAKIVSKKCDDFRERSQPQIGRVHDRMAAPPKVPADHTYGVLLRPDDCDARDLIHASPPSDYLKGKDREMTLISVARQHLKKANHRNFNTLLQAFSHYDKKGQGKIDKEDLQAVCRQFNLDLSGPMLDSLLEYCDVDKDGKIGFLEFANFLNWKDKMPIGRLEQNMLTAAAERKVSTAPANMQREGGQASELESLVKPDDMEPVKPGSWLKTIKTLPHPRSRSLNFATSSSKIGAVVGGVPTADIATHGVPTVRLDLAAPRIRRISDRTNYGDQATAYDLLHPPLHSLYGVHEEHFFYPRSRDQISAIFRAVGMDIPEETFKEAWALASSMHPTGEVCVEGFRNALAKIQTD
ncbi:EF-hand domain-containing family member B isoform X2 [Engraulis encrasicolus]|uniref:EF-hand domain-containing family member B isoform X2 n=1 Tax=Engraulis encrasicolus TaxID=184585 RepID=UPI002FD04BF0